MIRYLTLDKIIVDTKVINDKTEICNEFNHFFAKIGPKLTDQIKSASNKTYDTFLKKRVLLLFDFKLLNENDILKHLSSLRTKNSAGFDGISVKLSQKLSEALINPLTLVINQSLVTGIFPAKLKIAKILPLFKIRLYNNGQLPPHISINIHLRIIRKFCLFPAS